MKKIVAAAAAALLLAGAAFADVSFAWTGSRIFGVDNLRSEKIIGTNDCVALTVSNDIAGVVFDWDIADSTLEQDSYYGWLTYGLPVGNLQVTSGKWASRYVDRVNDDAGDLDSEIYEMFKPGVINGKIAADSDNLTNKVMSTVLAYTLADTLPGTLMVKGGIVSGDYGKYDSKSGFVGEVAFRQENVFNFNVALRSLKTEETSVGVFFSPLMVEALKATVGFSFGKNADDSEFGVDLRARYAITEKTAITGMFNYSKTALDVGTDGKDLTSMWTMLSVNHVAGDNIRFLAALNNYVSDFSADKATVQTVFTPSVEIQISEKATFTAACVESWTGALYSGKASTVIPVYVTFAL